MQLVLFLEEISAKALFQELLPRLLPKHVTIRLIVFEGKQDLEKQLLNKLRGWRIPDCRFVVLRDRDAGDCYAIKDRLLALCRTGGKNDVLIRIACRELESWYLGDLTAVATALDARGAATQQNKKNTAIPTPWTIPCKNSSDWLPPIKKSRVPVNWVRCWIWKKMLRTAFRFL